MPELRLPSFASTSQAAERLCSPERSPSPDFRTPGCLPRVRSSGGDVAVASFGAVLPDSLPPL